MSGKSCAVLLIGADTAGREWINYEIVKAWDAKKGVFGVYVHNLKDANTNQSTRGSNPFDNITMGTAGPKLSTKVRAYDPPGSDSTEVYAYIENNLGDWVDAAIAIRGSC